MMRHYPITPQPTCNACVMREGHAARVTMYSCTDMCAHAVQRQGDRLQAELSVEVVKECLMAVNKM